MRPCLQKKLYGCKWYSSSCVTHRPLAVCSITCPGPGCHFLAPTMATGGAELSNNPSQLLPPLSGCSFTSPGGLFCHRPHQRQPCGMSPCSLNVSEPTQHSGLPGLTRLVLKYPTLTEWISSPGSSPQRNMGYPSMVTQELIRLSIA